MGNYNMYKITNSRRIRRLRDKYDRLFTKYPDRLPKREDLKY